MAKSKKKTNDNQNVSTGKPKALGAVFMAETTEPAPTDATTPLSENFVCLGYVSQDGITNNVETEATDHKEWGGSVVLSSLDSRKETFGLTFIESSVEVLQLVYGKQNVTGTIDGNDLKVVHTAGQADTRMFVFEIVLNAGRVKRIVVPVGQAINTGEISYKAEEVIGYEMTITALPDGTGNTAYEYFAKVS